MLFIPLLIVSLGGCTISYVTESETPKSEDYSVVLSEESVASEASSVESHSSEIPSQNSEEESVESIEEVSESIESQPASQSESEGEERVKSISFINNSKMPTDGSHFDHESNNLKLVSIFNEIEDDFVKNDELLADKVFAREYKETVTLQVGSGSSNGGFMFESNYLIESVKLTCSPYFTSFINTWDDSENPYVVYSVDNYVEIDINNVVTDITYEGSEEPEVESLLFAFDNPTNEFSLFTTELSQRLFIFSMEFTYLV